MHPAVPTAATVYAGPRESCTPSDHLRAAEVVQHLVAARASVDALTDDLCGPQLLGPKRAIVNSVLWEIGPGAWFQEYWSLLVRNTSRNFSPPERDDVFAGFRTCALAE